MVTGAVLGVEGHVEQFQGPVEFAVKGFEPGGFSGDERL